MVEQINRVVHKVLVTGVILSFSIIAFGLILFQLQGGDGSWIPWDRLPEELAQGNAVAVVILGLLVLIATPLCRIIAALLVFAWQKDVKFVLISLVVLGVVILSASLQL